MQILEAGNPYRLEESAARAKAQAQAAKASQPGRSKVFPPITGLTNPTNPTANLAGASGTNAGANGGNSAPWTQRMRSPVRGTNSIGRQSDKRHQRVPHVAQGGDDDDDDDDFMDLAQVCFMHCCGFQGLDSKVSFT